MASRPSAPSSVRPSVQQWRSVPSGRRTFRVKVKVTGGGASSGAVSAHFGYISRHGELEIETDEGERIPKEAQKEFLEDWHLELTAGQYRAPRDGKQEADRCTLAESLMVMEIMDEIRKQNDLVYPDKLEYVQEY